MLPVLASRNGRSMSLFDELFGTSRALNQWYYPLYESRHVEYRQQWKDDGENLIYEATLPKGVDASTIKAQVVGNTIRVTIPKPQAETTDIPVEVSEGE